MPEKIVRNKDKIDTPKSRLEKEKEKEVDYRNLTDKQVIEIMKKIIPDILELLGGK